MARLPRRGFRCRSKKDSRPLFEFLYQRYQTIVENFESADIKVTLGIIALAAGFVAKDLLTAKGRNEKSILEILYNDNVFWPVLVFFLWGTAYSAWTRFRVLHAVKKLVQLENKLLCSLNPIDAELDLSYWKGKRVRPIIYLLLSPWPWLLFLFSVGSCFSKESNVKVVLLPVNLLVLISLFLIFKSPCQDLFPKRKPGEQDCANAAKTC